MPLFCLMIPLTTDMSKKCGIRGALLRVFLDEKRVRLQQIAFTQSSRWLQIVETAEGMTKT